MEGVDVVLWTEIFIRSDRACCQQIINTSAFIDMIYWTKNIQITAAGKKEGKKPTQIYKGSKAVKNIKNIKNIQNEDIFSLVPIKIYIAAFSKRAYWSKHRVETNGSFQNQPNLLEIVYTWCYRNPFHIVFPPCKVLNATRYICINLDKVKCDFDLVL